MRMPWYALSVVLCGLVLSSLPAMAQPQLAITVDFKDTDVKDAVQALCAYTGANFTIDPEVQGRVTAGLTGVPFDTALRQILDPLGATFKKDAGVYKIVKKKKPPTSRSLQVAPRPQATVRPTPTPPSQSTGGVAAQGKGEEQEAEEVYKVVKLRNLDPAVLGFEVISGSILDMGGGGYGGLVAVVLVVGAALVAVLVVVALAVVGALAAAVASVVALAVVGALVAAAASAPVGAGLASRKLGAGSCRRSRAKRWPRGLGERP